MKSTRNHEWKKKRMFKNKIKLFKFDFAEFTDNELLDKILNFFIDSTLNNDWKNEMKTQKSEQNETTVLNSAQSYHTTQSHTTHSFSVNVLLNLKNMNIISENENNEQFEKISTNKKAQIKSENEIEDENEIENENDNENFEKFFTNTSKLDKSKNRTKKINFETENEQFATTVIHQLKAKFEQKSEKKSEQKSETEQTDSFTIKSIKKIILKNLNVKQKKFFKMQTKFEIQAEIEKKTRFIKKRTAHRHINEWRHHTNWTDHKVTSFLCEIHDSGWCRRHRFHIVFHVIFGVHNWQKNRKNFREINKKQQIKQNF